MSTDPNQSATQPTTTGSPSGAPVDAVAGTTIGKGIGNPRDVQGILALIVIVGAFVIAAVAIWIQPTNVSSVLASVLPLAAVIIGYYFGQQSQKT